MQPFQLAIAIALSFVVAAALLSVLYLDPDWADWTWADFANSRPVARLAVRDAMEAEAGEGCTSWRWADVEAAEWADVTWDALAAEAPPIVAELYGQGDPQADARFPAVWGCMRNGCVGYVCGAGRASW